MSLLNCREEKHGLGSCWKPKKPFNTPKVESKGLESTRGVLPEGSRFLANFNIKTKNMHENDRGNIPVRLEADVGALATLVYFSSVRL